MGRREEMQQLRSNGMTLQDIGTKYGLSRQRVGIIIGKTGRVLKERPPKKSKEEKTLERFWKRVKKLPSGHWVWTASKLPAGYGRFVWNGEQIYAHKFSYMIHHEMKDVKDVTIFHKCGRKDCVNPEHLIASDEEGFNRWDGSEGEMVDPEEYR